MKKQEVTRATTKSAKRQQIAIKRKKAEANARRRVAKQWACVGKTSRYMEAAAKESCFAATQKMEEELFDGILLNLNERSSQKSYREQTRVLRRIVEKRQAQAVHQRVGRSADRYAEHLCRRNVSRSMCDLHRYQTCA